MDSENDAHSGVRCSLRENISAKLLSILSPNRLTFAFVPVYEQLCHLRLFEGTLGQHERTRAKENEWLIEEEERQGTYVYTYRYDDMGNRTFYSKTRNGTVIESAEYTYNASNQKISAKLYDGKKNTTMKYEYDTDGNLISETGKKGTDKVELTYDYTVENRLKAVFDADELLVAAAYDGDGNHLFQLNYNLHTDDDWKGNSGNGNGNNKDNTGSGNNGNSGISGVISEALSSVVDFFTGTVEETAAEPETEAKSNGNKNKDKGNDGNATNNGKGNGNGKDNSSGNNGNNGNSGNNGNGNNGNSGNGNGNTGTGSSNNGSDTANGSGNTTNTGGSQNQSGILMPKKPVSDVEQGLIDLIKTTGKHKNYELIEYVNDVNREYTEVLMEVNIDGEMDTAYTYGNERLTIERFTGWTGYYTNDPRGSVTGVTDSEGTLWKSYRYSPTGDITFGKPEYNNSYSYNAEDYNPNLEVQYLRARYYDVERGDFLTEDTYLGKLTDPLTLNRYNYAKSSPLNYTDPSGMLSIPTERRVTNQKEVANPSSATPVPGYESEVGFMQFLNGTKSRLEKAIQKAKESQAVKTCFLYSKGVQYGMSDFWEIVDGETVGRVLALFGNETQLYTDEEYWNNRSEAFLNAYKGIDSSLAYTNANVEDFRDGVYLGYHISLVALIPVLKQAIAGIMPSGSMTAQIKVQGLNGYQYNATVEIAGSAGGVSAGDIGAGLIIQQVTGSGSAKDIDKGDLKQKSQRARKIPNQAINHTRIIRRLINKLKNMGIKMLMT